jgi:hypothetical protein
VNGFIGSYVVVDRAGTLVHVQQESSAWSAYLYRELARWTGYARLFDGKFYKMRLGESVEKRVIPRLTQVQSVGVGACSASVKNTS